MVFCVFLNFVNRSDAGRQSLPFGPGLAGQMFVHFGPASHSTHLHSTICIHKNERVVVGV